MSYWTKTSDLKVFIHILEYLFHIKGWNDHYDDFLSLETLRFLLSDFSFGYRLIHLFLIYLFIMWIGCGFAPPPVLRTNLLVHRNDRLILFSSCQSYLFFQVFLWVHNNRELQLINLVFRSSSNCRMLCTSTTLSWTPLKMSW